MRASCDHRRDEGELRENWSHHGPLERSKCLPGRTPAWFENQTESRRTRGVERGRSGCARAELCASAERQEDGCTGESMLPPNTDDGNCVGPHGPSRRSGRSRCMSSSIGRPVQNFAAYPQLAKQTLALCAAGVQPVRPSVAGARSQQRRGIARSYSLWAPCGGVAGQLRASAREAVKGFIPLMMGTPRLA